MTRFSISMVWYPLWAFVAFAAAVVAVYVARKLPSSDNQGVRPLLLGLRWRTRHEAKEDEESQIRNHLPASATLVPMSILSARPLDSITSANKRRNSFQIPVFGSRRFSAMPQNLMNGGAATKGPFLSQPNPDKYPNKFHFPAAAEAPSLSSHPPPHPDLVTQHPGPRRPSQAMMSVSQAEGIIDPEELSEDVIRRERLVRRGTELPIVRVREGEREGRVVPKPQRRKRKVMPPRQRSKERVMPPPSSIGYYLDYSEDRGFRGVSERTAREESPRRRESGYYRRETVNYAPGVRRGVTFKVSNTDLTQPGINFM
jgi:hypothetical protein